MSQLNINTIKNKKGDYGPNLVGHSTVTGDLTVTGIIVGNGEGLTGIANTANIKSDTIVNSGIITSTGFVGPLTGNLTGDVTGNISGTTGAFSGGVTGDVTGNLTGDVTGNLTGDVTGNLTGDVTGNISGTTGTFSGDVSIGGTLTYEDVTNIDSVGMITARKGIQVLADGINAVGVVTATSFSGDGSNLTGLGTFSGNYNDLTNTPSIASQAEAEAGTNNTNLMTPLRVKQAIDALGGSVIASIQRGTYTWPSGTVQTTQNVTITSVDTSKTMMNYLGVTNKNNLAQHSECILQLTNSTTVTITRSTGVSGTASAGTKVSYEVIEFA